MDIISIEGMEFHSYIGCFEEEKIIGTRFIVDLYLSVDAKKAMQSDDLKDTVNYQVVYLLLKEQMNKKINFLIAGSILFSSSLFASPVLDSNKTIEKKYVGFLNKIFKETPIRVSSVRILNETVLNENNWTKHIIKMTLVTENNNDSMEAAKTLFYNGKYVSTNLYDLDSEQFLSEKYTLAPGKSTTTKERLIYGLASATNKIIIYSDPLCPFCREEIPSLLNMVKEDQGIDAAIYLVNVPLVKIHPASATLVKVLIYQMQQGKDRESVVKKIYSIDIDPRENSEKKILDKINSF